MTKDIQLFDYQEDMVKRVQEAFRHHDSVMVQMGYIRKWGGKNGLTCGTGCGLPISHKGTRY